MHNFNDVDYYDKEQKIVVKVTDVNFDPNNSEVSVTCGGNTFSFENWKEDSDDTDSTDGSVYTATISISDKDADIITNGVAVSTVEVTAYDKAELKSKESRSSEESGKSKMTPFIVDTTKPTFEISFSENVEYFYQKQQVDDTYMYYLKLKKPVEIKNGQSLLALDCAVEKYEALINYPYPSFADRLNYAIVLRMSNKNREAKALLEALKSEYGDDYRVLIQLAFVCHELGETTNSAEYCESGYEAWKKIPNRQSSESETMQDFFALAERYGIREDEP